MEWLQKFNQALDYVEDNLEGEIEYETAARIACCSTFHFQRMFSYIAGIPLGEYIRRRRMTAAAFALQSGEERIVDLALRYGYDSPTAFNRAFQSVHGTPPSRAREKGVELKAYPRISFRITVKGEAEMNYRIENLEAFRIVGLSAPLPKEIEQSFQVVPGLWQRAAEEGIMERLCPLMDGQPAGILGVSACKEEEAWAYFIARGQQPAGGGDGL